MENSASHKIFSFFFLLFFFVSSVPSSLAEYSRRPEKYFINCGSNSNSSLNGQTYEGDLQRSLGQAVKDFSSPNTTGVYQTAWVFTKTTSYDLVIDSKGTYVVRFHFLYFKAMGNLGNPSFDVDASGFRLLSVGNNNSTFPLVEEFLLTIPLGKFSINFKPHNASCFAFVNAVEVFSAPTDFIYDTTPNHVTEQGYVGQFTGWLSCPLHVIHRINVGGSNVTRDVDPLLRFWIPDDDFLLSKVTAKNSSRYTGSINYNERPGVTKFIAPVDVYNTAKQMNTDTGIPSANYFNVSWRFPVRIATRHYVRVHFCDIVNNTLDELKFYLFIYDQFKEQIDPYRIDPQPEAIPFFKDYTVESDESGFMNISIGPPRDLDVTTAFLNGIEIMELVNKDDSSTEKHLFVIIGPSLGGGLVLVLVLLTVLCVCRRKKWKLFDRPLVQANGGGSSYTRTIDRTPVPGTPLADLNLGLKITLHEILYATKNFDSKLMIGQGGFGKVYKGILKNGTKVAVKRSEPGQGQGLVEFENEITVLSKIKHQHLVSLIGYCKERGEMILVYEFMEKGTLRDHLYSKEDLEEGSSKPKLLWDQRLNICIGAAKGLIYLHTGSEGSIIHRDIKSTNILLDENYVAKVADFGLSRLELLEDDSQAFTGVKGTFGYLDPEYCRFHQLTQKSDVYSFGAVLLEVLCDRPVIDHSLPEGRSSLIDWAMHWQGKGRIENVVDPLLMGRIDPDCLRKYGEVVAKCLQEEGSDRPSMIDVLWDLEYCLKLQRARGVNEEGGLSYNTDVSLELSSGLIGRLPSHSMPIDEDDEEEKGSSLDSSLTPNQVFSQLRIDEAAAR